jgi:hypothetical protein
MSARQPSRCVTCPATAGIPAGETYDGAQDDGALARRVADLLAVQAREGVRGPMLSRHRFGSAGTDRAQDDAHTWLVDHAALPSAAPAPAICLQSSGGSVAPGRAGEGGRAVAHDHADGHDPQ